MTPSPTAGHMTAEEAAREFLNTWGIPHGSSIMALTTLITSREKASRAYGFRDGIEAAAKLLDERAESHREFVQQRNLEPPSEEFDRWHASLMEDVVSASAIRALSKPPLDQNQERTPPMQR